jgi:DeoR family fructose operon transcriptional repressor
MITSSQLLADQRRDRILAHLAAHGTVRTADLAAELQVSSVTIRRDLLGLQSLGVAVLVHGGARVASGRIPPADRRERSAVEVEAKTAIAGTAVEEARTGDVIFLDSGTTCAAMVPALTGVTGITVVTTDLSTATSLAAAAPQISVVIAAGLVDPRTTSAVGELLPAVLQNFVFDVAFISASAWEVGSGATTGAMSYAAAKRSALARAKRSILLVDASKHGATEAYVVRGLQDFDAVISDGRVPPGDQRALRDAGVNLLIAGD